MKKQIKKNKSSNLSLSRYEKMSISRIRTNTAEFPTVIRGYFNDINTGGIAGQSFSIFLNNPTYYRNAAGSITQMNAPSILANEQKVFDEYKVKSLKVSYLPFYTGQVRVANVAVAVTAGSPISPLLILGYDLDDSALFTSAAKATNSQQTVFFNKFNAGQRPALTMNQVDKVDSMKWLNLGALVPNLTTPPDPNNPSKLASVKTWTDAYMLANNVDGIFICEWTVLLKGVYSLSSYKIENHTKCSPVGRDIVV